MTLIAVGFDFIVEPKKEDEGANSYSFVESFDQKYPTFEKTIESLLSDEIDESKKESLVEKFIQSVLHPPSTPAISEILKFASTIEYKVHIVMNEPVVDTSSLDGFQIWIDWFDRIKLHADAIDQFKRTLI